MSNSLQRKFKAFNTVSVAALNNFGVDTCRRALCECTHLNSMEDASFDFPFEGNIPSVIKTVPPKVTDLRDQGTVWIAYKPNTNVGAMWLRCGNRWRIIASFKSLILNEADPTYRAVWNVKGDSNSFGNRQIASSAFCGFPGRSFPNSDVYNPATSLTICNTYTIEPIPGYYDTAVINTKDTGDLNEGARNLAETYENGKFVGTRTRDGITDTSIAVVSVPIVITTLPSPAGNTGYYHPVVNGSVQTNTKIPIPQQSANFIAKNPFISRFIQYRIRIPDGKPLPVDAVRFLFLNSKIIPWIKGNLRNGKNLGINYYNTPAQPSVISSKADGSIGPEGVLISGSTDYFYFYKPTATSTANYTSTHVAIEFTPSGGNVYSGDINPVPNLDPSFNTNIVFTATNEDRISYNLDSIGTANSSYLQDGDIIVQYYSHVRACPGLYSDVEFFDQTRLAAYTTQTYKPSIKVQCNGTINNTTAAFAPGVSNPSGNGTIVHMAILRFRHTAAVNIFQGGVVYTPNTEMPNSRGFASYYHAYFMAPASNAFWLDWNLDYRPNPYNVAPASAGLPPLHNTFAFCKQGTAPFNTPNAFGVYNPSIPSASILTGPLEPYTSYPTNVFSVGMSFHSKIAINNFGISFYNNPKYTGTQELGRGTDGAQVEILNLDSPHYIPISTIRRVLDRSVFVDNTRITYTAPSPYKPTLTSAIKTFKQWLLDELVDIQAQTHIPLSEAIAP